MAANVVVEFVGMAGTGKTFLAVQLQPLLEERGFKTTFMVHGPLNKLTRTQFHGRRLLYAGFVFLCTPKTGMRIVAAVLKSRPKGTKRFLIVTLNTLYKLGSILFTRNTLVLDEGLIHAVWAASLYESTFPEELVACLLEVIRKWDIHFNVVKVVVKPDTLSRRFEERVIVAGHWHRLAPNRKFDVVAFERAGALYQPVIESFEPIFSNSYTIDNEIDEGQLDLLQEIDRLAETIVHWVRSAQDD